MATTGLTPVESVAAGEPKERWIYTTKGHFSLYGLLAFAPIFRDRIRTVLLDPERIYLAVVLGRSGILFQPANEVQILALDRQRGHRVWEQRLPFDGYPIGDQLVLVGGRLVAALYQEQTKDIVVIGMNRADGGVAWRVSLPGAKGPMLVGDEVRLDADHSREAVIVTILGDKQRRQVVLRADTGMKVAESIYRGYTWRSGARRAPGLSLGYEGDPPSVFSLRKYERVLALHEASGQLAWSFPLLPKGASPPTVSENSLLLANGDRLLRIDLQSGQPRWEVNLGGRSADDADPPAVIGPRIAVAHTATPNPEDEQWMLSIYRLADGNKENELALYRGEGESFSVLRPMGDFVIVASYFLFQVVDPQTARIVATLERRPSRFVYAGSPSMHLADSDAQGFVVVTSDGRLGYFAAKDFRNLRGELAPAPGGESSVSPAKPPRGERAFPGVQLLFYLVVNPLWNTVEPNRSAFWVLFYTFPFALLGLAWLWKPLRAWLQQLGIARAAGWGTLIGGLLALPAAIYRGLLGGMAAGFGAYGALGPIWGAIVGYSYFLGVGLGLGAAVGSLVSLLRHR